ncbi:MAG: ACT domain-containing protein [Streptosporangiaceae bacterium]
MLLRIRVRLPDRPGSLGKVARTLGAAGADVVQMAVLEQDAGRALDDFTVLWPAGVSADRLTKGLAAVPGVSVEGLWPTIEAQGAHSDVALVGQLAVSPEDGLLILTDALPGIISADWAALLHLGPGKLVHMSLGGPAEYALPEIEPLRARAFQGRDGTQYALAPITGTDLAIVVAREHAPEFHRTEVDRLEQLIATAGSVLGDRLAFLV